MTIIARLLLKVCICFRLDYMARLNAPTIKLNYDILRLN